MKEAKIKLYEFKELQEEIQDKIIEKQQFRHDFADAYADDYESTLEAFEKLMGIKVKNWSVDSYTYDYRVQFTSITYYPDGYFHEVDGDEIKGKYLWRYIMNNVHDYIFPRKQFYSSKAGWNREKHRWNKQRLSRCIHESWNDCVLTGVCYDCDILKPIADYLSKPYKEDYTLYDLVTDCLDNFFTAWKNEIEYCNSYEAVKEYLTEIDDEVYYEDGTVFVGILAE